VIGKKFLEDFCQMAPANAAWILSLMAVLSALSGVFFAVLSRAFGNRKTVFIRISGCMPVFVFTVIAGQILCDARSLLPAVLFCLLSMTASISAIAIPLLHETNAPGDASLAVCLLNSGFYFSVAVFGNGAGIFLSCFPPEIHGAQRIHTPASWLATFCMFLVFSCIAALFSFRVAGSQEQTPPFPRVSGV
jgi:MFS family permease